MWQNYELIPFICWVLLLLQWIQSLRNMTSIPNPAKSLGYIKCYSSSSPRSAKSPSNSIRRNCQKICSWLRRSKTILEMAKRPHFSRWSTILLFTSFSKTLLTIERRLTGRQFLAVDLSLTFLNTGTTDETFHQSGKQNSLRHLLKSSANM